MVELYDGKNFLNLLPSDSEIPFAGTLSCVQSTNGFIFSDIAAGCSFVTNNTISSKRRLPRWVFCVVLKGNGGIVSSNKQKEIYASTGYLIPPKVAFIEKTGKKENWYSLDLLWNCKSPEFLPDAIEQKRVIFLDVSIGNIQRMIELAVNLCRKDDNYRLRSEGLFLQVMADIGDLLTNTLTVHSDMTRKAYFFMRTHLHVSVSVEMIAEHCYMSASTFARRFRKETGLSPMAVYVRERIREAKSLLARGKNVGETADMLGFENQFYFSRVFNKIEGISPQKFRNSLFRISD